MAGGRINITLPWPRMSRERQEKVNYEIRHLPWIPIFIIGVMVFAAVFAPILAPYSPTKNTLRDSSCHPPGSKVAPANTSWVRMSWGGIY